MAPSPTIAAGAAVDQIALQTVKSPSSPVTASKPKSGRGNDYKGFVAGVFSGIAKLTGMYARSPGSTAAVGRERKWDG